MKRYSYWLLIPLTLFLLECGANNGKATNRHHYDYQVKVVRVIDGDTFRGVTDDRKEIRFRIHGIDAPEKGQPFSRKSKEYLSDLIYNKRVGIVVQNEGDRYGRPVVWVYTPEGKDVSAEMIGAGMAWHYKYYSDDKKYASLEKKAQNNRVGIWSDPHPVMPWELRKNHRKR